MNVLSAGSPASNGGRGLKHTSHTGSRSGLCHARASFFQAAETVALTGCAIGAIPPFSFDQQLRLLMDAELVERYTEIAFNAGRLDQLIVLTTRDYLRIAQPAVTAISMA